MYAELQRIMKLQNQGIKSLWVNRLADTPPPTQKRVEHMKFAMQLRQRGLSLLYADSQKFNVELTTVTLPEYSNEEDRFPALYSYLT